MPKASLKEPFRTLESQIIETLIAGHKEWRPDLSYPESHSDMQGAVRGLLRMFKVERLPIAIQLPIEGDHPDLHITLYPEQLDVLRKTGQVILYGHKPGE